MSRPNGRGVVELVDQNDPALEVDGLSELLPAQTRSDIDRTTLAVNMLEEFFPERPAADVEDYFATVDGPLTPGADDSELEETRLQVLELAPVFDSEPAFQSEIQRAATEFQRFAEKFHAFANECQHRGAL